MQGLNLTSPQKPAKSPDLGTGQASTPFNSTGQSPLNNGPALVGTLAATDVPEGDAASILQQLAQRQQVYNQLGNFAAAMQHEASQADVWRDKLKELECLRVEKRALSADLAAAQAAAQARALEALEVERAVKRQATAREAELQTEKARCRTLEFERQTAVASLEVLRADAARLNGEAAGARALSETNAELTGELVRLKRLHGALDAETRRSMASMALQVEQARPEKLELTRHLANAMEAAKALGSDLELERGRSSELREALERAAEQRRGDLEAAKAQAAALAETREGQQRSEALAEERGERLSACEALLGRLRSCGVGTAEEAIRLVETADASERRLNEALERGRKDRAFELEETRALLSGAEALRAGLEERVRAAALEMAKREEAAQELTQGLREELSRALAEAGALRDQMNDSDVRLAGLCEQLLRRGRSRSTCWCAGAL
mmetsp:Transcript_68951/g.155967  ORF Transcript_68951/g.155967 Transcript_68951/m.155967 type:complete len:444 (+) Transcript_68951:696-2027(+)